MSVIDLGYQAQRIVSRTDISQISFFCYIFMNWSFILVVG